MGLEGKLAALQVETAFLHEQLDSVHRTDAADYYLKGFWCELEHMYASYRNARKALQDRDHERSARRIGDFAMSTKNAVDNLNLYIQEVYGEKETNLKFTKANLSHAPGPRGYLNMHEFYRKHHSFRSDKNSLVYVRNQRAHGDAHSLIRDLDDKMEFIHNCGVADPEEWLEEQVNHYLDMKHEVIGALAGDVTHYAPASRKNIHLQRLRNTLSWHSRAAKSTAAVCLFAVGISLGLGLGTYFSQADSPVKEATAGVIQEGDFAYELDDRQYLVGR